MVNWKLVKEGEPWMVPPSPPMQEQPETCEGCEHHWVGAAINGVCFATRTFGPEYGMPGCVRGKV